MSQEAPVLLSIVCPMYNEGENLHALFARLFPVLESLTPAWELVLVDDGSADESFAIAAQAAQTEPRIRALKFSRNFGKEIAIAAGLHHARGQVTVLMDADLQHPPEVIPQLIAQWQNGYDMVYGVRQSRDTDSALRRFVSRMFYKVFSYVSNTNLPEGAGDFRLMSRKIVDALNMMPERNRFTKGLYSWVGFKHIGVPFEIEERLSGQSHWGFRKLLGLAIDGITAFSSMPLRVWTYIGLIVSLIAFVYAMVILTQTLLYGADVPGFPTIVVSVMMLSGIQLLSLGVLGEYLGRIFTEVKGRPLYLIAEDTACTPPPAPMPTE